jgi:predicted ArsR family transcriptional regulator
MQEHTPYGVVKLETEHELRVYMLPLRQRIMRLLHLEGHSVTSKHVADKLEISPSSARHHLNLLMEIGLVEHDHYEHINGIKANYLRPTRATVSIGDHYDDGLKQEQTVLVEGLYSSIFANFKATMEQRLADPLKAERGFPGDLFSAIAHLTQPQAEEFYQLVRTFLEDHALPQNPKDTPWECAFLFYNTSLDIARS